MHYLPADLRHKAEATVIRTDETQGLQANQQVTFLSDGADDVQELPLYLSPESEHWLDWFHVAMRLRVMGQMAKGLVNERT